MYAIISEGNLIALCDKPNYIKINPINGIYITATENDATGVAVKSVAYNLEGHNDIPGGKTAYVVERDNGMYVFDNILKIENNKQFASIAFVTMAENGTIDDITASEHSDLFANWNYPIDYIVGQLRRDPTDHLLYKCIQAHTSQADWQPSTSAALWRLAADPLEEYPAWSQPIGAMDAYNLNDKVSHNGKHWISLYDNNVWEPGIFGWSEEE